MLVSLLFGALVASFSLGTYSFEDCKEREFEPKACVVSEKMDKAAKLGK